MPPGNSSCKPFCHPSPFFHNAPYLLLFLQKEDERKSTDNQAGYFKERIMPSRMRRRWTQCPPPGINPFIFFARHSKTKLPETAFHWKIQVQFFRKTVSFKPARINCTGNGTFPYSSKLPPCPLIYRRGTAARSAWVYSWAGEENTWSASPYSTMRPLRITAMRSAM